MVHVQLVHVEGVLGQGHAAVPEQLGAVNDGVHQHILALAEMPRFLPAEHPALGQGVMVAHGVLVNRAYLVVDVITHQQVDLLLRLGKAPQTFQHLGIGLRVHPVVGVHHLEIQARGVGETRHHRVAVAAVFLVDGPDDARILAFIRIRDLRRVVPGAVVHDQDLHLVAARQQGFHRMVQVVLGIVAWDGDGQQLHMLNPLSSVLCSKFYVSSDKFKEIIAAAY